MKSIKMIKLLFLLGVVGSNGLLMSAEQINVAPQLGQVVTVTIAGGVERVVNLLTLQKMGFFDSAIDLRDACRQKERNKCLELSLPYEDICSTLREIKCLECSEELFDFLIHFIEHNGEVNLNEYSISSMEKIVTLAHFLLLDKPLLKKLTNAFMGKIMQEKDVMSSYQSGNLDVYESLDQESDYCTASFQDHEEPLYCRAGQKQDCTIYDMVGKSGLRPLYYLYDDSMPVNYRVKTLTPDHKFAFLMGDYNELAVYSETEDIIYQNVFDGFRLKTEHTFLSGDIFAKSIRYTQNSAFCVLIGYDKIKIFSLENDGWLHNNPQNFLPDVTIKTSWVNQYLAAVSEVSVFESSDGRFLVIKGENKSVIVDLKMKSILVEINEKINEIVFDPRTLSFAISTPDSPYFTIYRWSAEGISREPYKVQKIANFLGKIPSNWVVGSLAFTQESVLIVEYVAKIGLYRTSIGGRKKVFYPLPYRMVSPKEKEQLSDAQKYHMMLFGHENKVPATLLEWYDSLPESIQKEYELPLSERIRRYPAAALGALLSRYVCGTESDLPLQINQTLVSFKK